MIDPHTAYALSLLRQYDPDRAGRIEGAYRVVKEEERSAFILRSQMVSRFRNLRQEDMK